MALFTLAGVRALLVGWESNAQERIDKFWYINPGKEKVVFRIRNIVTGDVEKHQIPNGAGSIDVSQSIAIKYGVRPVTNPDSIGDLGFVDGVEYGLRTN